MGKVRFTKRELDELGRQVVIAGRPTEGEIDNIVSDPALYDGVLAKIAGLQAPTASRRTRSFGWKPAAVAAMVLALLSIPMLAVFKFTRTNEVAVRQLQPVPVVPDPRPFAPAPLDPPEVAEEVPAAPMLRRAAMVTRPAEPAKPMPRIRKPALTPQPQAEAAFQPIGLQERAEDAAIDGRVVRVEVPRATLFAMGVNLPIENGTRSVKADLLLGPDGSPRAIRLVE